MKIVNTTRPNYDCIKSLFILLLITALINTTKQLKSTLNKAHFGKNNIELKSETKSMISSSNNNLNQPSPGLYGGECLRDLPGPPYCIDPRLECITSGIQNICLIGAWQRCDKVEDYNTKCADMNFKCIDYKIEDSKNKLIGLCAPKGSYLDTCSATLPCSEGFKCSEVFINTRKENLCLVDNGKACESMKLCANGFACELGSNTCKPCKAKKFVFENSKKFSEALVVHLTCDAIQKGGR